MMATLDDLQQTYNEAAAAARLAQDAADAAAAELLRHQLLAFADEHPGTTGYSFDVSSEYDDQGGYYDNVTLNRAPADDANPWWDELDDLAGSFSPAVFQACFMGGSESEGDVSVEALRAREVAA